MLVGLLLCRLAGRAHADGPGVPSQELLSGGCVGPGSLQRVEFLPERTAWRRGAVPTHLLVRDDGSEHRVLLLHRGLLLSGGLLLAHASAVPNRFVLPGLQRGARCVHAGLILQHHWAQRGRRPVQGRLLVRGQLLVGHRQYLPGRHLLSDWRLGDDCLPGLLFLQHNRHECALVMHQRRILQHHWTFQSYAVRRGHLLSGACDRAHQLPAGDVLRYRRHDHAHAVPERVCLPQLQCCDAHQLLCGILLVRTELNELNLSR